MRLGKGDMDTQTSIEVNVGPGISIELVLRFNLRLFERGSPQTMSNPADPDIWTITEIELHRVNQDAGVDIYEPVGSISFTLLQGLLGPNATNGIIEDVTPVGGVIEGDETNSESVKYPEN